MKTVSQGKVWLAVLWVALCAAMLMVSSSDRASAYTLKSYGQPGGVTVYKALGSHVTADCGVPGYQCYLPWVIAQGPVVSRSSASTGTQLITVVYSFQKWNGNGWVNTQTRSAERYLYAGSSRIEMPRGDYTPNSNGYFRVHTSIGWSNASGTVSFGSRHFFYNQSGDYACRTNAASRCNASNAWVYLQSGP